VNGHSLKSYYLSTNISAHFWIACPDNNFVIFNSSDTKLAVHGGMFLAMRKSAEIHNHNSALGIFRVIALILLLLVRDNSFSCV